MDMDKYDSMYTDDSGDKHPCYVQDTMPGKHGYTGIVYLDHGAEKFEFVETDTVTSMNDESEDHTIEVWTLGGTHFAECTCGWQKVSPYQPIIEQAVRQHREEHDAAGECTEVV